MTRRILFISDRFSGLESFLAGQKPTGMPAVYLLLTALIEQGYEVYWILMGQDSLHRRTFDLLGGRIHVICCKPVGASGFDRINRSKLRHLKLGQAAYGGACLCRALGLLRHTRVDLVYGAGVMGALVGGVVASLHRLPRISRLYGSLLYFMKHQGRPEWLHYDYPAEVLVFKRPGDAIILTNDGTRCDRLAERFGTDPTKVYFWLNGVDKGLTCDADVNRTQVRQRLGLGEHTVMLLTLSRLSDWKRVDRAIRAMAALRAQHLDCRLIVIGEGPDRDKYEALAKSIGAADVVVFMGALPHREATETLRASDIFLSLYDYSNLGNPVIEAMVSGSCVVSIADGSLDGIVTDGVDGILVAKETLETELPIRLAALIQNPGLRQQLGTAAAQTAARTFLTWRQRIAAEIDIIGTLCAGARLDSTRPMAECAVQGSLCESSSTPTVADQ